MAKITQRKLRWTPSDSPQVVGYKLYWAIGGKVDYTAEHHSIGNVTELTLPDDVPAFPCVNEPMELGLTAVNEVGNESDMVTLSVPFQFATPSAPRDLTLERDQADQAPADDTGSPPTQETGPDSDTHADQESASPAEQDHNSLETFQV